MQPISCFVAIWINSNHKLKSFEKHPRLDAEIVGQLGNANMVVLGMGRVGKGVYNYLKDECAAEVIGVEEDLKRCKDSNALGFDCVHGDATDRDFWERTGLINRDVIYVSLSNHRENLSVVTLARELGYKNTLAVSSQFEEEKTELEALGCISFNVYSNVGTGFAEHVTKTLHPDSKT